MEEVKYIEGTKEDIEKAFKELSKKYSLEIVTAIPKPPNQLGVFVRLLEKPKKSFLDRLIRK